MPQTVGHVRLDTLEEWYQEANFSTILLTDTQSLNGPKKIAMNFLYWVVLGSRLMQIKHFLLPYEGPHYPNYLYN